MDSDDLTVSGMAAGVEESGHYFDFDFENLSKKLIWDLYSSARRYLRAVFI